MEKIKKRKRSGMTSSSRGMEKTCLVLLTIEKAGCGLEVQSPTTWMKARWLWAVLSGRLAGDIREEAFNPRLEIGAWTQLEAGAGDMDLEGGHIKVIADTVRTDELSEGESKRRELRPIWGKHSRFSIKYQKYHSKGTSNKQSEE